MRQRKSVGLYSRATKVMVGGCLAQCGRSGLWGNPQVHRQGEGSPHLGRRREQIHGLRLFLGALIHGHADGRVAAYVKKRMNNGTSFGAPTEDEVLLAEKICRSVPSVEKVRFVNSGTEATMSALRVARGYTKRNKVLKFDGCYHGHADPFLTNAGSGMATFDIPASAGVTPGSVADTVTVPYNDVGRWRRHSGEKGVASQRRSWSRWPGTWGSSRRRGGSCRPSGEHARTAVPS